MAIATLHGCLQLRRLHKCIRAWRKYAARLEETSHEDCIRTLNRSVFLRRACNKVTHASDIRSVCDRVDREWGRQGTVEIGSDGCSIDPSITDVPLSGAPRHSHDQNRGEVHVTAEEAGAGM
jgi:hypothetical protein